MIKPLLLLASALIAVAGCGAPREEPVETRLKPIRTYGWPGNVVDPAPEWHPTADRLLVSSTGVFGVQLPIEKIEAGVVGMAADLQHDPMVGAEGIMTTDSHP